MAQANNPRLITLQVLLEVLQKQRSLSALSPIFKQAAQPGLTQAIGYGVLRHYWSLHEILRKYLQKSLKSKDLDVELILLMGLFQLSELDVAPHAIISETVQLCKIIKKVWAVKLVNAVLRNYQRDGARKLSALSDESKKEEILYDHPQWLVNKIKAAWPGQWKEILLASNQFPPMSLRINRQKHARTQYLSHLHEVGILAQPSEISVDGVILQEPCSVDKLPGFFEGDCSVQDIAAQLAAQILAPQHNEKILDACAAPGGKTMHLFEIAPDVKVVAIDQDAQRLKRVEENALRLLSSSQQQNLKIVCASADDLAAWWNGEQFDKILLDAPCSATGVIRRHPDIKHLRQERDFSMLTAIQSNILMALWKTLKPGGQLLYATCSIMPEENEKMIQAFLEKQVDASEIPLPFSVGIQVKHGCQIFPGMSTMDGFYYCLLKKNK